VRYRSTAITPTSLAKRIEAEADQASRAGQYERLMTIAAEVAVLAQLCDTVIKVHEQVVMDTAEDRELHDRACATFRALLATATEESSR
jgi:hypothetical protein